MKHKYGATTHIRIAKKVDATHLKNKPGHNKQLLFIFSHMYHFLAYSIKKPKMQHGKGIFIISIDVDVGSRELGVINKGINCYNVNRRLSEYRVG